MSCPNCGSWAVKADRSLGGRMVCGRCGQVLGGRVIPLRPRRRVMRLRPLSRRQWWGLGLVLLLGVSAGLVALESGEPRRFQSSPGQGPL